MSTRLVIADHPGTQLQSQISTGNQNVLALSLLIENLRILTLNLMKVVETLEEFQSRSVQHPVRLFDEVERFEKTLIESALKLTGGHQTRAAKLLGVKLTTLHSKIKNYRISARRFAMSATDVPHHGDGAGDGGER